MKALIIDHHIPERNLNNRIKKKKELIEDALSFLFSINKNEKVGIIYHRDGDGVFSAFLIYKILNSIGVEINLQKACNPSLSKELVEKINRLDTIISCDLSIERYLMKHNLSNCVHLNSVFFDKNPTIYSATILSYELLSHYDEILAKDCSWLLSGALCDFGYPHLEKFTKVNKKMILLEKMITTYVRSGGELAFDALATSNNIDEIIYGRNLFSYEILKKYKELRQKEKIFLKDIKSSINLGVPVGIVENIWITKKKEIEIFILQLAIEEALLSNLIGKINKEQPNSFFCFFRKTRTGKIELKLRCPSKKIKANEIAKKLGEKFNGHGGGHPDAAGADLKNTNPEEIVNFILECISE